MARVPITAIWRPSKIGTVKPTPQAGDATDFNTVANTGRTLVIAKNTGVTTRALSILLTRTVDGQAVVPVAGGPFLAGEERLLGPYEVDDYSRVLSLNPAHADLTFLAIEP